MIYILQKMLRALIFIVVVLSLVLPTLGQCPIPCPRLQYTYSCCSTPTVTCCQGSMGTAECSIPLVPAAKTQQVYVEDCIMKNLTRATLVNLTGLPVVKFSMRFINFETQSGDLFAGLTQLSEFHLSNSFDVHLEHLHSLLASIEADKNITVVLDDVGMTYEDVGVIFDGINVSRIVSLSLASNMIRKLPLKLLQTWSSLGSLNFTGNKISDIVIPTTPLGKLKTLILKQNRLSQTESWGGLCEYLPKLEKLDLSTNELTIFNNFSCSNWTSLKSLDLSRNRFVSFNFSLLQNLNSLERLDISRNWLTHMSSNYQMKSLKILNLNRNEFSKFTPWFCLIKKQYILSLFPQLEELDLSSNLIRILFDGSIHCLDKLRILKLNGNPLAYIKNNTFANLTSLEELFLSDNINGGLEKIDAEAFYNTNMKHLELQSNGLIFDEKPNMLDLFKYTTNLRYLNLAYNKLEELNETGITRLFSPLVNVEFLNLTRTDINRLPKGFLGKFKNLTTLILAKNKIESVDLQDSFSSAINLNSLSISQNFIRVVHNNSFIGKITDTLKELDLSFNPFECNCENLWFRNFIDDNKVKQSGIHFTHWPEHYCCKTQQYTCAELLQDYHPTAMKCQPLDPMIIAYLTIASFVIVFTVTACFVFRFRWYIKFWMYKMKRKENSHQDPDTQPLVNCEPDFDAYVIYSHKDKTVRTFIKQELNPMMKSFGYRLFVFDRDAGVGAKVCEIGDGIYGSKHVIALVTSSFLKDKWCKFQTEVALDREIRLQREFLMFVVLDDVDVKLLSKFWCVRFTKTPTARWCSDTSDIRRKALEALIKKQLGEPR